MTAVLEKALRADAQRNYDVLVATAKAEFTARGADVPLEDIARRAKVGIGTLYRHFPTRDDLLGQVLRSSTAAIIERAKALSIAGDPADNLFTWIREFITYTATYQGLSRALANSFVAETGSQLCTMCDDLSSAGAALLARAQAKGAIRKDAQIIEIILSAQSAAWVAEQTDDRSAVERMLGILFDGLRAKPSTKKPSSRRSGKSHRAIIR